RDRLHDLVAAPAEFSEVKFALLVVKLAVAPLFDAIGQISGDVFFQPPEHERAQPGGKTAAGDALGRLDIFAAARFVYFEELLLFAQVIGLDEIDDAPKVEQSILQRRARQRQAVFGLQLFYRLC